MNAYRQPTYTKYQVDKLLAKKDDEFEKQWQEKVEEIQKTIYENTKIEIFSQFLSIAMATLEQCHEFTEEQSKEFYKNFLNIMNIMKDTDVNSDTDK